MPNYIIVPDYLVDRHARNLAAVALTDVCPRLKISKPALNWFFETRFGAKWFDNHVLGWCAKDGRTIFIRHDCSPFEIANTIVHECRHSWQITNPRRYPIPGKTYTRTMNREQAERDCKVFEMEFWNGREKRNGSFDDITRILTDMQIQAARALIQARSQQYAFKQPGLPFSSSFAYPSIGKTKLIVPSEKQMEENLLQQILNG